MTQFEIRHRYTDAVLYTGDGETLRDVVVAAVANGAYLNDANLNGADLHNANLNDAYLRGANLNGADLRNADLINAYLSGANLRGADLRNADLCNADLRNAYLNDANLNGADLRNANLCNADLSNAYLNDANLRGRKLIGGRPVLQIGPIGSRCAYLVSYLTDAGVMISTGCFFGTLDEFRSACLETHGDAAHGREYAAAIAMIEAHTGIWTPSEKTA